MADYTRARSTAERLLIKFGRSITIGHSEKSDYNPDTGGFDSVESAVTGIGVLLNYTINELNAGDILATDRKMIFVGGVVSVDDRYNEERVVSVKPLDPDESGNIIQTLQLRK